MDWDCAVVGGGAAGLSAALVLGRARRRTIVIDADQQSNRAAPMIGGLLGYDRRPPGDLYEQGRRELASYPSVEYVRGVVQSGQAIEGGFILEPDDGDPILTKRVLLATGMRYCPPDLPGLADLWGVSVFQCPFCHGWEMRDKRLATLAAGEEAMHSALMLRGWSDDVVLLTDGRTDLTPADVNVLNKAGVAIEDRRVVELHGENGQLSAIAFADGDRLARDGLLVEAPLQQRSRLAGQLGAACTDGPVSDHAISIDEIYRTGAHGVFAAGDLCTEQPYVAGAIAAGAKAAMILVQSLLAEEFGLPYPPI
jgi:thioredoxin reductase